MGLAQELEQALTNVMVKFGLEPAKKPTDVDSNVENFEQWHGQSQEAIPNEPTPIPVVILDDKAKFQRTINTVPMSWTSQKFLLQAGVPQLICGNNPLRAEAQIHNNGQSVVAIDSSASVKCGGLGMSGSGELNTTTNTTAPIIPVVIKTTGEIWAVSLDNNHDLTVIQTFHMGQGGQ